MWHPELEHNEPEVTEYPLEEEYEDELHRLLLTKGDTETMKKWLEQEAYFTPKLQCDSCKARKYDSCNLMNNSSSIEEKELYISQIKAFEEAITQGKGVAVLDGKIVENLHVEIAKRNLGLMTAIEELE